MQDDDAKSKLIVDLNEIFSHKEKKEKDGSVPDDAESSEVAGGAATEERDQDSAAMSPEKAKTPGRNERKKSPGTSPPSSMCSSPPSSEGDGLDAELVRLRDLARRQGRGKNKQQREGRWER